MTQSDDIPNYLLVKILQSSRLLNELGLRYLNAFYLFIIFEGFAEQKDCL